jgi:hypothetical protein
LSIRFAKQKNSPPFIHKKRLTAFPAKKYFSFY